MRKSLAKRLSPILVIALLAILVIPRPNFVRAETGRPNTAAAVTQQQNQFRDKLQGLADTKKSAADTAAAKLQQDKDKNRTDKIVQFSNRLHDRFGLYDTRLLKIVDQLQEKIDKLKTAGKNTTEAQAKLDKARQDFATAKQSAQDAITLFEGLQTVSAADEKSQAAAAEEKVSIARQEYVTAIQSLQAAIVAIRSASSTK